MCASQTISLVTADSYDGSVHSNGLAHCLVKDILRKHCKRCFHVESDSSEASCWPGRPAKTKSWVNQRLKYWKTMIAQRRTLQKTLRVDHVEELNERIRESQRHSKCGECLTGLCVRINGLYFRPKVPQFPPTVEPYFTCDPFQRLLRTVIRIENSGNQVLHFSWQRTQFFSNNDTLFRGESGDFVFDTDPFSLAPGAVRDVSVLYQPRCVAVVKQRWLLVTRPQIFLCCPCGITLNIHGCCTPPREYLEWLALEQPRVPTPLEPRLPLDNSPLLLCPYTRELDEREAFRQRNRGFQCRSHWDMERLKEFFELVKPQSPGFPGWNFSVHSLIHLVCAVEDSRERISLFSKLTLLLSGLRGASGQPLHAGDTPERLSERWHTKLIYVRGILGGCLQEWDEKVQLLSRTAGPHTRSQCFRDAIHLLLHGLLCQAAEDVVSVIESTAEI